MPWKKCFKKIWLIIGAVRNGLVYIEHLLYRYAGLHIRRIRSRISHPPSKHAGTQQRNISVVGASMVGYHADRTLAESIIPNSPYLVVVIELYARFQFTWAPPWFSVTERHGDEIFIPYGPYLSHIPDH
ncbi:hypothetical protein F4777DRAFT_336610 [Nemania sp. FL0916]|nr:hypothetical protein F4777DRAFT_336610 [Nemania sp. FL0916]